MTTPTATFLAKAQRLLAQGEAVLAQFPDLGGRCAYQAAFHAAQALILARDGRVTKTHRGVQVEFARLTREEAALAPELRGFLSRAYNFKTVADYGMDADAIPSTETAAAALATAHRFVAAIAALLPPETP